MKRILIKNAVIVNEGRKVPGSVAVSYTHLTLPTT